MIAISSELALSALDAAPDAIIILDDGGVIKYTNRQVAALFGYSRDELLGVRVETLMPKRFGTSHVRHREGYVQSLRVRPMGSGLQLFGRRRDETEFPIEVSLSPMDDGNGVLIAGAIRDVTARRRIEAELIVARDMAHALQELADRASQGKSRFLATASHDLRQPLQVLSMLNGTLRRLVTDASALAVLAEQEKAISAMTRLLNALLEISKLESGTIKPDPADFTLTGVFDELRSEFGELAGKKGLALGLEDSSGTVHSDPALVGQILRHLLTNALMYTRQGFVRVHCVQSAGFMRIDVHDTGIGIPADQLGFIFDEFFQVGVPVNSSRDGYGLGLTIVRRLVSLLMLKLDVRSELGRGTTFSLLLPLGTPPTAAHGGGSGVAAVDSPRPVGGVKILLVEDDVSVRCAMAMLLELEGYDVTSVSTLPEALQHVNAGHGVDLLVSDFHLSHGVTGIQVIDALRGVLGTSLPVILTTGDSSSAVKQLPGDAHLRITSKPISAEELLALLPALLAV